MKFASRALQERIRPIAPPAIHHTGWKCALKVGMPVLAKWKRGFKMWGAKVVAVNSDGTFSLHYDDGDKDQRVPRALICAKVPEKTVPAPPPAVVPPKSNITQKIRPTATAPTPPMFTVGAAIKSNTTKKIRAAATAPTPPKFAVGAAIEARWKGGLKYYGGKIARIN